MRIVLLISAFILAGCPKNGGNTPSSTVEVRDLAGEAAESGVGAIDAVPVASAAAGWQMSPNMQILGALTLGEAEPVFADANNKLTLCFTDIPGGDELADGLPIRMMVAPNGQVYEAGLRKFLENEGPWVGCVISALIRLRFPVVESEEPSAIYRDLRLR